MTDKIKTAFNSIHVEELLKETTLLHLQEKRSNHIRSRCRFKVKQFMAAAACLSLIILAGAFSHNVYFTEAAYIDLDINPSLGLTINRFSRIINTTAYNEDGTTQLTNLNLQHKKIDIALSEIIEATARTGILQNEGLVSVTVQSLSDNNPQLLADVQTEVTALVSHHATIQVDVFSVDSETRNAAQNHHISPAMYLAILELQEVDPAATIDECKNHTINEIRELTQKHGGYHHGQDNNNSDSTKDNDTSDDAGNAPGHHGKRNSEETDGGHSN